MRSIGVALKARRLETFLDGRYRFLFLPPGVPPPRDCDGLAGWGVKGVAIHEARRRGLPYLALEDGFLSTAGLGGRGDPALSLTADAAGMHYDCSRPCTLEHLIQEGGASAEVLDEAGRLMDLMRRSGLGKYNGAPDAGADDPIFAKGAPVIVVDQIRGDRSIVSGGCGPETFAAMLDAAIAENPGVPVFARVHPVEGKGGRRGHLRALAAARGVPVYDRDVSWMSLARSARQVYVATSMAGLEALVAGTRVTCFGMPIYAGWGLTDDRSTCGRRSARPTLQALVAAIYLRYARYLSPLDGRPCSALEVARLLAARRRRNSENAGAIHVLGVHPWKAFHVRPFIQGDRTQVTWTMDPDTALERQREQGGRIVAWSSRAPDDFAERCGAQGATLTRMEDGFLRSVGLGANLEPPASLVFDRRGVYYDPSGPSDLEDLLQTADFDAPSLETASTLRQRIVELRLSKYNVGMAATGSPFAAADDRPRILVPGQVANDASVLRGGGSVKGNLQLLAAVRAAHPTAFIVYKPHPDVEAGLRPGALGRDETLALADGIASRVSIADLLDHTQEVHTLTSLSGFEALLRGLPVATYGMPFYAGWGLTRDLESCSRRTRRLKLDELVAATLVLYPRYVHPESGWPCEAMDVVNALSFSLLREDPLVLLKRNRRRAMARRWLRWRSP